MAKTERITIRVEPDIKRAADDLFRGCGLSTPTAINLFLHRSVQENGLPFPVDGSAKAARNSNDR